jgi:predicted nuclease of restriction endonuclease-like (RecB) superfamily
MSKKEINKTDKLFSEIRSLIEKSRRQVAVSINSEITILYWNIGKTINNEILKNKRAEYGKQVISSLSKQLTNEYGKGWSEKQLRHCLRIAETFADKKFLSALSRELTWTHLKILIYIDEPLKRDFYIQMCKMENWSTRTLQNRINSLMFERTAISKKPEKTIKKDLDKLEKEEKLNPDLVFRDPYVLDFLGLNDSYSEKDFENAILFELQKFIIELGSDFAFLARQKRITIDNEDYYLDLLFFHRRLRRLVVIELKLGQFKASYKGQMELYLRWLEKHEKTESEESPIGLILCASKNEEHIELLQLEKSNIRIAEYCTELPDLKLLEQKLHQSIKKAREKINNEQNKLDEMNE